MNFHPIEWLQAFVNERIKKSWVKITKTVTTAGTAVPLFAEPTNIAALNLTAKKVTGDNTGNTFLGLSDLDKGVDELHEHFPGDYYEMPIPPGVKVDGAGIYIDSDNDGDGYVGWYLPA